MSFSVPERTYFLLFLWRRLSHGVGGGGVKVTGPLKEEMRLQPEKHPKEFLVGGVKGKILEASGGNSVLHFHWGGRWMD